MMCISKHRCSRMAYWGLLVCALLQGCGEAWKITAQSSLDSHRFSQLKVSAEKKLRVAVLPFSSSGSSAAGDHITELFMAEVVSVPHFELVDQQQLMERLKDKIPNPMIPEDVDEAVRIGQAVGVEVVVLGHITAYRGRVEVPDSENFGLVLRMFDTHSGQLVWSANHVLNAVPVEKPIKMDTLVMYTLRQGVADLRHQMTVADQTPKPEAPEIALTPAEIKISESPAAESGDEMPLPVAVSDPLPVSLKEIQAALSKLGFSPGAIDGIYGRNTRRAIQAFQRKHDLEPDGAVSVFLLDTLNQTLLRNPPVVAQ